MTDMTITDPTPQQVLDCPMDENDSGTDTIRGYLVEVLATVWDEGEGFSGKRPFGNSGWEWDLHCALVKAGFITGVLDAEGFLDDIRTVDRKAGRALVSDAIRAMT